MNNKRNRIPTITEDRIDLTLPLVERPITAEDIRRKRIYTSSNYKNS